MSEYIHLLAFTLGYLVGFLIGMKIMSVMEHKRFEADLKAELERRRRFNEFYLNQMRRLMEDGIKDKESQVGS